LAGNYMHVRTMQAFGSWLRSHARLPDNSRPICLVHTEDYTRCNYLSLSRTGSTSITLCAATTHLSAAPAPLRLCRASGRVVSTLDFSSVGRTGSRRVPGHSAVRRNYPSRGRNGYTSPTPRDRVPRHVARLVVDYFAYAARPGASARRAARRRLLHQHRAPGWRGSSRGSSRRSSLTTSPRAGSSSTTSPTPRVQVPRHVARLVVDFFAYVTGPGAPARRVARHRLLRLAQARRRLLRLRHASGCLGTSRGSSRGSSRRSSSTTSPTPRVRVPRHVARLVVDYFTNTARLGATARHVARRAARRRLLRLARAHRRLLRLHRASRCLGTSRGSLSTSSPMPRVRVPRHVAQLVTRLVVD
jgi:hypothetical protein